MIKQDLYIARLIARHISGEATEQELSELTTWRKESSDNEALYQLICNEEHIKQDMQQRQAFDVQQGWQEIEKKLYHSRFKQRIREICKYAAILILPLAVATFLLLHNESQTHNTVAQSTEQIMPGSKKATLTLDNGETIDLNAIPNTKVKEQDGTTIQMDSATLNYQLAQNNGAPAKDIYNKVDIPRGGEYTLTLSDGTKVHLNSMSTLRYPVQFTQNIRQVELQGEGYFEVSKTGQPFIVKVNDMQIEVLGTTFNISAYPEEDYQTTLVNGSVRVQTANGNNRILKPSEQASITPGSNNIEIRTVDTAFYTSWIHGKINFKDQRLEDIMKSLARWYDMKVVYDDEKSKDIRFGCYVNRYNEIKPFVDLLEKTGKVSIKIEGKTIKIITNH
ncbi:FecR family protein [Phocaeicola sp.]